MSTIMLPSQLIAMISSVLFTQNTNQRVSSAPFGGSEQAIDLLNDRWTCHCEVLIKNHQDAAAIEAYIAAMRGQVNTSNLFHFVRTAPAGTVRGTLTLSAAAAQGASSIVVTGCSPATGTLLAGDMLGVGGLLVMVQSACTAVAGVITIPITNRLRAAQSIGAAVTWNMPTAPFRLLANSGVQYIPDFANPVSFDFGEKI